MESNGKDPRVNYIMVDQRKNDKSFTEKGFLGIAPKYRQHEVREIWLKGIEYGIEMGLLKGSLEGQVIDITNSCKNEKHKEFYNKFLDLANEYRCAIQYHPEYGMCVIDLETEIIEI